MVDQEVGEWVILRGDLGEVDWTHEGQRLGDGVRALFGEVSHVAESGSRGGEVIG